MTQTCCGQPAWNSGDSKDAAALARQVIEAFEPYDHVVAPSGSCAGMVRVHYPEALAGDPAWAERARGLAAKTHEITSFLADVRGYRPNARGAQRHGDLPRLLRRPARARRLRPAAQAPRLHRRARDAQARGQRGVLRLRRHVLRQVPGDLERHRRGEGGRDRAHRGRPPARRGSRLPHEHGRQAQPPRLARALLPHRSRSWPAWRTGRRSARRAEDGPGAGAGALQGEREGRARRPDAQGRDRPHDRHGRAQAGRGGGGLPGVPGRPRPRTRDPRPRAGQPRPLPARVREERDGGGQQGALGRHRRRGLPDRRRHLPRGRGAPGHPRQVDAGRGDRPAARAGRGRASSGSRPTSPSTSSSSPATRRPTSSGPPCTAPASRRPSCSRPATAQPPRGRGGRGPGRERAARAAGEVPLRRGRHLRRQLPDRRHGGRLHRHQRGQRRADHDPAQGPHRHRGHREAPALDRARLRDAAPPRALGHRRRADPVHDLPLRPEASGRRRRARGDARRPGRQRPHADAGRPSPARDAALHPLRRLHEPLRRLPPDRRPRLRLDLPGPDGGGPHPRARRASPSRATCRTPAR